MKNSKSIALTSLAFLVGVLVTFLMMKQCSTDNTAEQSHVIAYQIQRMNKMIVAEQNYSDIYSYQSKKSFPGFERFYSADKSRSKKAGGTGLGLSIALSSVQLHGGEISVESHEGEGSLFRIIIPTVANPEAQDQAIP